MTKMTKSILLAVFTLFILAGCEKEVKCPGGPNCEPTEDSHTFLMYMVAENNLSGFLRGNVEMALIAARQGLPANSRILVYWDGYSGTRLTEISEEKGQSVEKTLKTYAPQNSVDPKVMQMVLNDVKAFAPAEVYGIALGSHATGWFPPELNNLNKPRSGGFEPEHNLMKPEGALTRAFGADGSNYMSITDLAQGLSPIHFNYIITDACFMSSVEALYDLRNSADYMVSSPVEVMGAGLPYHKVLPVLFDRQYVLEQRLASAVSTIINYYNTEESVKSAAFTLVGTSKINALADAAKEVYTAGLQDIDISNVQVLELVSPDHAFFDMRDYISQATMNGSPDARSAFSKFDKALSDAIIFESHTPSIYSALGVGGYFNADRFCGISTYIPREKFPVSLEAYYNTAWAQYTQPQGFQGK